MTRSNRFSLGIVAAIATLSSVLLIADVARAEEQCISQKAKQVLATCPGGKFQANVNKKPQVSFNTAPESIKKKDRVSDIKPVNPNEITKTAQRDERAARLKPKVRRLLLTEIANVERLYKSTPKGDKDRPQLMRRLAEGYVELESSAFADKVNAEVKAQENRTKDPKAASEAKESAKKATDVIKVARKNAINFYQQLKDQYPKWCQFPDAPAGQQGCIDEVLYYLAYEYEQAGDLENARNVYLELTENWKKSRFVPNAYLAFGELYFQEAQGDPAKWPFAQNFYKEVLKYDPPDNKLWGYAAYKLGYVFWNQSDYGSAIAQFKSVIEFADKFPQLPNAKGLAQSARRDIIPVYALKGDPGKAYDFFRPLSGDQGVDSERTFKMMEDLGQNLLDTGHYEEAIVLYNDLKKRNKGEKHCFYQAQITQAVMASKSSNKPAIVDELTKQLGVYTDFQKASHGNENKLECANTSASLLSETAMAWHLEAVGSGGVRGTGDAKTMDFSAKLYKMVIDNFTTDQFKAFTFPRIVKEDWPSISKIKYAMADLLYFQKKWAECGPAFDEVVAEDPNGPNAAEAAFASVLCYQNIYAQQHADGSHRKTGGNLDADAKNKGKGKGGKDDPGRFKPKELTPGQKGMITAFDRYICYIKPPENDAEALEQYVEVKFARARTYYESQRFEEAAEGFTDIAKNHPKLEAALFAAQLALDSLNVLGSLQENPNPECLLNMEKDVPKYIESFCSDEKQKKDNDEQCSVLFRIQRDIQAERAAALVKKADGGAANKIKLYEEAGNLYYDLWKKYGIESCKENKPACEKNDKILYNGARAFQAARLIAKAIQLRTILIQTEALKKSDAAKLAVYEIGGNYQAIAVYADAADWYERFANEQAASADKEMQEKAANALSDAVVLRLGLGQQDKAIEDSNKFSASFSARNPAKAAQIAFAIGAFYAERQDWKNAEKALSGAIAKIDQQASFDVKLQAHAVLGRTYLALKQDAKAETQFATVRDSWKDPAAAVKQLDSLGGSDAQRVRRIGKTLTAVGEAMFFFAEKRRAEVDKIKFPEYKGSGEDKKEINDFVNTKVTEWFEKKEKAIKETQEEYFKIVNLKPSPPPIWVIHSGSAVGAMWGQFVDDFLKAPYPKKWDQPGEIPGMDPPLFWQDLRAQYQSGLQDAIDKRGYKKAAKLAFETCLGYSVKYQYFDSDSRSCEKWLSKNYGKEYHLIDEFKGTPNRVNSPLDEQPQALNYDGQPIVVDTREQEEKDSGDKKPEKK
jgi:TolA-binding protein